MTTQIYDRDGLTVTDFSLGLGKPQNLELWTSGHQPTILSPDEARDLAMMLLKWSLENGAPTSVPLFVSFFEELKTLPSYCRIPGLAK